MIDTVRKTIGEYSMLKKGDKVIVGLSGGADSMSLLDLLLSLRDEYDLSVYAVHINHCIRGDEAQRDETFVRDYCRMRGVPLTVYRKDIPSIAAQTGESEEECGRRIRYECFSSVCDDGVIATAHTLSDSIETMVFNLLRGCTLSGLCGIPAKRDNIIRPLISCTRQDIEDYCRLREIPYITDSTNLESEYTRNYIRNELMPMFGRINQSYIKALARCRRAMIDDNAYLEAVAEEAYNGLLSADGRLFLEELNALDNAVKTRVIYRFIRSYTGVLPENKHIYMVLELAESKGSLQMNSGFYVKSDGKYLYAYEDKPKENKEFFIKGRLGENLTPSGRIILEETNKEKIIFNKISADKALEYYVDCDKICGDIVIRSRKAGDRITLPARNVTKTLKKLFTENKIPAEDRASIPVIADDEKVLWVWGIGYNKLCEVDSQTKRILKISIG